MGKAASLDTATRPDRKDFDGPFLFCDYWASVLNLKDIVNLESLSVTGLSLEVFRKILNRPAAGLPKLGYYIVSSLFKPLLVLSRLFSRLVGVRPKPRLPIYNRDQMRNLLLEHALKVEPKSGGLADVFSEGRKVAGDIVDPFRLRAVTSMFFARYKVFLASLVALGYGALVGPVSGLFHAEHVLLPYLGVLSYPIVLLILWVMFDDLLTAVISPLPLIAIRMIITAGQGFQGFVAAVVGTAFVLYLVEWFFIPRSLPAALYLYINDRQNQDFPYRAGHEPYWLQGRYYWVWRYVTLAPAELLKFWEKDWERLEIWVRAEGDGRGRIEWIVTDFHYRELWFKYESFVSKGAQEFHDAVLGQYVSSEGELTWIVEMDMSLAFHSPVVKGVYIARGRRLSTLRRIWGILNVILRKRAQENPERYKPALEILEIEGSEFLDDVPEHFRTMVTRRLLSFPWSYWRFPLGVTSSRTISVYGSARSLHGEPERASDPRFQIKEPGRDIAGLST